MTVLLDKNVLWLEVPVDDISGVDLLDGDQYLSNVELDELFAKELLLLEQVE